MNSQGDKGAESEGYKKQTPTSTNPQTDQHPSHRNSSHRQNNPSEGKANCYIKPATETLANIQVTQQHRISLVVSKLRVDGEFTG